MISKQKRFFNNVASVCVLFALVVFFTAPLQARLIVNGSSTAFVEEPSTPESVKSISSINSLEVYVMQGAGYFLKSYSNGMMVSNLFEMSDLNGINWDELKYYLDQSVYNMEMARDTYVNLVYKANNTPYKKSMIEKLVKFDYNGYKVLNDLNGSVFKDVKDYLVNGDVRGIYVEVLSRIDATLSDLYSVKGFIEAKALPTNNSVWRLNQKFSETQLFGQYAAEIFYAALSE